MAQQSPTDGDVKLGGGIRKWMMPSQPSAKLSKHGRLGNAHEHNITLPSASPDVWCTMQATKTDKVVYDGTEHKSSDIFRLANKMRKENVDVVGDKPVKNDAGEMSMSEEAKQNAWAEHYERLLNIEFDWDPDHLSNEPPLEGPPIPITIDMVKKAISMMKSGKAAGPSGIVVEMIKAAGDTGATMIRDLATAIIRDGKVPTDWEQSFIVCLYKGKGDALDRANYRGLKLTEQTMKILERIVDGLIRQVVSDRWCLLTTPSLALSQEEALQIQYLWSDSCRRNT